jgi:hypothetical protein
MLKHRNKSIIVSDSSIINNVDSVTTTTGQQHPRSPSIDITSVFPQQSTLEGGAGGAGDAFQLFEEAFPYPIPEEEDAFRSSPLVKLLSSPSIPATSQLDIAGRGGGGATTSQNSIQAQAQAQAESLETRIKARSSSIGNPKGLKELELVKKRLSWESISGSSSNPDSTPGDEERREGEAQEDMLTDEEKFQDALEEGGVVSLSFPPCSFRLSYENHQMTSSNNTQTILPTPPRLSPIRRSSFPAVTTAQVSPLVGSLPTTTEDTLSLGMGLGIDLVSSSPPPPPPPTYKILSSREQVQGPLHFDELKEIDDTRLDLDRHGLRLGLGLGIVREREFKAVEEAVGLGLGIGMELGRGVEEPLGEMRNEGLLDKRTIGDQ